jgi:hypothetical protein
VSLLYLCCCRRNKMKCIVFIMTFIYASFKFRGSTLQCVVQQTKHLSTSPVTLTLMQENSCLKLPHMSKTLGLNKKKH